MPEIVDISKEIDRLIAEFPGNQQLQISLKVIEPDDVPLESLTEVVWSDERDLSIARTIICMVSVIAGEQLSQAFKRIADEFINMGNRIMIMQLMWNTDYCPKGVDHKLMAVYIQLSTFNYRTRIGELMREMAFVIEQDVDERRKLARLFGESIPFDLF
jgi:hypothetical protein